MPAKPSELRRALQIDRLDLDMELVRQPELFYEAGDLLAAANADRDTAKEELSQIDARLYFECRRELERSDGKASEAAIKNAIEIHDDHIEATKSYLDAKEWADRCQTLKESFSMRSYMLKDLAGLYVANYYQTDATKGGRADEYRSKRNMERIIEGRSKRRVRYDD